MYLHLFEYWKKSWTQLYSMLKSTQTLDPNDFFMQDKVTAIMHGDQVVAMHLLKNYEKSDFAVHPYFKHYNSEFMKGLEERNVRRVQSFQFFWVDLGWSKKITGVNFSSIIGGLSLRFQKEEGLDASITIARKDIKVNETAERFGFKEIAPEGMMHNVPVALMACFQPDPPPDLQITTWCEYYWNNRTEYKSTNYKTGVAA
jgi:hypothetical protein